MTADGRDFGAGLRQAREARGLSLAQIAVATKISPLVLEALERNDLTRLPGGLFSRALVRAYAREVGLDPEEAVREFVEAFSGQPGPLTPADPIKVRAARMAEHAPASDSGRRWLGLVITVVLIAVLAVVERSLNRVATAPPPPPVGELPPPPPAPRLAIPSPPAVPSAPEAPPPETGSQPPPAGTAQQTQPTAPSPPPSATTGEGTAPVPGAQLPLRVVLAPHSECWVSVRVDGTPLPGRLLQPGERMEVSAAHDIVLRTGDAGALAYTVNNIPGRPLGPAGQPVTVTIDTKNYKNYIGAQ